MYSLMDRLRKFRDMVRQMGLVFTLKYKLGIAREGVDFIDCDQEVF